jgi:hypothetical protein
VFPDIRYAARLTYLAFVHPFTALACTTLRAMDFDFSNYCVPVDMKFGHLPNLSVRPFLYGRGEASRVRAALAASHKNRSVNLPAPVPSFATQVFGQEGKGR